MKKLRALYYARVNRDFPLHSGISRKCEAQVAAFRQLGVRMDAVFLSRRGVHLNGALLAGFPLHNRLFSYFFYLFGLEPLLARRISFSGLDFFFLRYPLSSPGLLFLLRLAKKCSPGLRIVLEFPTFPYDLELRKKGLSFRLASLLDQVLRKRLKQYVDFAVHYGEESQVLGIPAIGLRNGITLGERPEFLPRPPGKPLELVAVGNWNHWHGLDRLLKGMAEYYAHKPERQVRLTVAGEGPELPALQALAVGLSLEEHTRFVGCLGAEAVKQHLLKSDMGIGTLGLFRKKVLLNSSLKHREYCAHGLPFILSTSDPDFPAGLPYVLYFPEADTPVDVHSIILFLEELSTVRPAWRHEFRVYAERNLSWLPQMEKVLQFVTGQ